MQIIETVKQHPYMVGGAVIGGVVLIYLLSDDVESGGSMVVSGPSPDQVAAGTQLQAMAYAAQDNQNARIAELQQLEVTAGAAIEAAYIEARSRFDLATLEGNLLKHNIDTAAYKDVTISSLEAAVANRQIDLEGFRTAEASINTQTALNYEFRLGKKELQNENKQDKRGNKTARKYIDVLPKIANTNAGVVKDANTKSLIGGIIDGVFGIAGGVVNRNSMPVETKKPKKKGNKK